MASGNSKPVFFDEPSARRIAQVVRAFAPDVPDLSEVPDDFVLESSAPLHMKVKTAADSNGVAVCNTYSVSADGTPIVGTTDFTVLMTASKVIDQVLFAVQIEGGTGKALASDATKKAQYIEFAANALIPCLLTKDGGSDGTKTSAPTYTYTVKTTTGGFVLLGLATPVCVRDAAGSHVPATHGSMCFVDGVLKLWEAIDERLSFGGCPT